MSNCIQNIKAFMYSFNLFLKKSNTIQSKKNNLQPANLKFITENIFKLFIAMLRIIINKYVCWHKLTTMAC